jgi:hypothetical protein
METNEEDFEDIDELSLDETIDEENLDDFSDSSSTDSSFDFGGSEPSPLGGIYGLFKDTLNLQDSTKVSNLSTEELGIWNLSLRDCKRIALISSTFGHSGVADFFDKQSKIITDTAMSKKGWFTELFVTSKNYASRESSSMIPNLPNMQKSNKWKIFSKGSNQKVQEN